MAETSSSSAREQRVDAAIASWFEALEAGAPLERAEFLSRHAELADELTEFLADHERFQRQAGGLQPPERGGARPGLQTPERLGDFDLVRFIGRGGMAVVYEAIQRSLGRRVALKVLPADMLDPASVERFRREAAAAAALQHPHIVPIYATGEDEGTHYYAMELISGPSLDAALRGRPAPPCDPGDFARIAGELAGVASALQAAHERGIIHRDIKPSNLLCAADGRLLVSDFGLACSVERSRLTQTGDCIGSPAYMSPEQADPAGRPLDERTDIYSLGATLYEALTHRPPFTAESRGEVLAQILHAEPPAPRKINPHVPAELETICLHALEKDPRRRYQSAAALAEDLRRFDAGQPIAARRAGWLRRGTGWARRRSTMTVAAIACLALACALFFAQQARQTRQALHATQLQDALDDALLAALGGELSAAEQAIGQAETLGASAGRVALLRGQTAYFRGEYDDAVESLQASVELLPADVAARSMYAAACVAAGRWQQYEESLAQVEQMTPATPEDHLFRGLAETYLDPRRGLQSLDQAVELRNWPLARLIRAEVRTRLAQDTGQASDAGGAVEDAGFALEMLPDHAAALLVSLDANIVAADILGRVGDEEQRAQSQAQASRDAESLKQFSFLPLVVVKRAHYLLAQARPAEARDCLERAAHQQPGEPILAYNLSLAQYRGGDAASAMQTLDDCPRRTGNAEWLRIWLLMERGTPGQVTAEYQRLQGQGATGLEALFRPCLPLLHGQRQAAADESRQLLRQPGVVPSFRSRFYRQLLAFNAAESSSEELLATAGASQWDQSEAHFFLALERLAAGDRSGAKSEFAACRAGNCHGTQAWDWSDVALARLTADPAWPDWIPYAP